MSLYLGNLSSRTRKDDLERVFRRFGKCTIQVKENYGFAVYDYPASAEKALKTLGGNRICGEAITLSWSRMQPRAPGGSAKGGRAYEPPSRKPPVKENVYQRLGSNTQRDHRMDFKQPESEGRKPGSDLVDGSTSYRLGDLKAYVVEREPTANGRGGDGKNHLEDDRWGEQVVNPSRENIKFDRYEPYHSDGKKEPDEHKNKSSVSGSPAPRKPQEGRIKGHDDRLETRNHKSQNTKRDVSRSRGKLEENHERLPRREDSSPLQTEEVRDKKRNRKDYKTEDQSQDKRAKIAPSSPYQSDYNLSRSQSPSRSLESLSKLKKKSSSHTWSSTSRYSEDKPFKSTSASRSMSPTLSPSARSTVNAVGLAHSQDSFEEEPMVRTRAVPAISENVAAATENECEARLDKLEERVQKNLSEREDGDHTTDTLLDQSVKETRDTRSVDFLEHMSAPESDASLSSNPASISSDEIYMALKHYGLQYPEEAEKNLPAEIYFGCARSWPWEIIYYRRLKKGPISAENYARRIAQNEEFGIIDKYIRGSSGWGERPL